MRILVVSNIYPPVVRGGYEVECSGVVERLREHHDVHVLTSTLDDPAPRDGVTATLPFLTADHHGTLRAPRAAFAGIAEAHRVLEEQRPDMIWIWNGAALPQTLLGTLAASGVPTAFRVCEHWFADVFSGDRFADHLRGGEDSPRDRVWGLGMRLLNRHPKLRYDPARPVRAAISWNSEAIRRMAPAPACIDVAFQDTIHSTSRKLPELSAIERRPSAEPSVLFLGRKDSMKGADVVVRAVARLRAEHGLAPRLVLAGPDGIDGPGYVAGVAREAGVTDLVDDLPPLDAAGVAEQLAGAHVLVVPSTWPEPYPLVSIEGAAARVPLVASRAGGIPEFVHDDVEGLLFDAGDADGCADALARTLGDPEATARRVAAARAAADAHAWDLYLDASERFVHDAYAALTAR